MCEASLKASSLKTNKIFSTTKIKKTYLTDICSGVLVIVAESLPVGADHSLESIQHPTRDTMGSVHMYRVYTCTVYTPAPPEQSVHNTASSPRSLEREPYTPCYHQLSLQFIQSVTIK